MPDLMDSDSADQTEALTLNDSHILIEAHSDVGFAVILLTPDHLGGAKADATNLKSPARQNVILELGYFLGKLTRSRAFAVYTPGVGFPLDYQGVLWIELNDKGAWLGLWLRSSLRRVCRPMLKLYSGPKPPLCTLQSCSTKIGRVLVGDKSLTMSAVSSTF